MARKYIVLFCLVASATAAVNECTSEDRSACATSGSGLRDDTNVLIQRKVDTSKIDSTADNSQGIEEASTWKAKAALFSDSMTMTARVKINGVVQTEGTLAAFGPLKGTDPASQVRGVQSKPGKSPFGAGVIYLITTYADAGGEVLTFRFKKNNRITTLKPTRTFEVNGNLGSAKVPIDFEEDTDAWDVNPSAFSDTMTFTAQVKIDDVIQSDGVLAAFAGGEVRGVQYVSGRGPIASVGALYEPTVYGNDGGDLITFKFMGLDGTETELAPTETFVVNGRLGSARKPYALTKAPPPTTAAPATEAPTEAACGDASEAVVKSWVKQKWGGELTCAQLKGWGMCDSPDAQEEIPKNCGDTCNLCSTPVSPTSAPSSPTKPCADESDADVKAWTKSKWQFEMTCANLKSWSMCNTPEAKDTMPQYCAATCDLCSKPDSSPPTPPSCADKPASEVGGWTEKMWGKGQRYTCAQLNGFRMCVAPDQKDNMAKYCAKTCNAC